MKKILIIIMMMIVSVLGWSSNHYKTIKKEKAKSFVVNSNKKTIKKHKKKKANIKKTKRKIKKSNKRKIKTIIKKVKKKENEAKNIKPKKKTVTLKEIEEAQVSRTRLHGDVTFYGKALHGNLTASGERFSMYEMTAAHNSLPMNSLVRVTNKSNGKSVTVRINDRGILSPGRILDLSEAAFTRIASRAKGVLKSSEIIIEVIKYGKKK